MFVGWKSFLFKGAFLFNFRTMKDNFSDGSGIYARYRPSYPAALFEFIKSKSAKCDTAWDCGTGNGQTAFALAKDFRKVFATDISQHQLDHARRADNIFYSVQPAESTNFEDDSFDLVTVSQALHWFDFDRFYDEVRRVAKHHGIMAAWTYSLPNISPSVDKCINEFYAGSLHGYWDAERKFVDENYQTIPFPFTEIACPPFTIELHWTLNEIEGYLNSWSAVKHFIRTNGYNPVEECMNNLNRAWDGNEMAVNFPVHMRMGRIEK
jgi:SAM-dependent methyltransferase